ncbi:MAG: EVE domain-containing protein [Candidatus Eisenbacteria bacterium]|nr:EVE domain-containing protein [Candidatus Eisenbacteria bacterium]
MASFLFKTEPTAYSYADLVRDQRAVWDGVSNALALIHLRAVRKGDVVVVYHSGKEKRAVGLALAASNPYPDPKLGDPKRVVVDLKPGRALPEPVPLPVFKRDPVLRTVELVRLSRLSIMPLDERQLARLLELARAWP